jgi:hypothetical protein
MVSVRTFKTFSTTSRAHVFRAYVLTITQHSAMEADWRTKKPMKVLMPQRNVFFCPEKLRYVSFVHCHGSQ